MGANIYIEMYRFAVNVSTHRALYIDVGIRYQNLVPQLATTSESVKKLSGSDASAQDLPTACSRRAVHNRK